MEGGGGVGSENWKEDLNLKYEDLDTKCCFIFKCPKNFFRS